MARLLGCPGQSVAARELVAATGIQSLGGTGERQRMAVTKRIRATIAAIAACDAALGYHLRTAIRTGHSCVYSPDPEQPIDWVVTSAPPVRRPPRKVRR
ncbi:MAG: hypothetical protein HY270_10240 [Deltaproteobacteria bacterium]|nr:hypothetical protein [Deltaproteobacteria bacterium]